MALVEVGIGLFSASLSGLLCRFAFGAAVLEGDAVVVSKAFVVDDEAPELGVVVGRVGRAICLFFLDSPLTSRFIFGIMEPKLGTAPANCPTPGMEDNDGRSEFPESESRGLPELARFCKSSVAGASRFGIKDLANAFPGMAAILANADNPVPKRLVSRAKAWRFFLGVAASVLGVSGTDFDRSGRDAGLGADLPREPKRPVNVSNGFDCRLVFCESVELLAVVF